MFKIRQPLFNMDGAIGAVSESSSVEDVDTTDVETASASDDTVTASEDVTKQQSFANRLKEQTEKAVSEAKSQWEKEQSEKFKDYDTYRKATEYLQKTSGIDDVMTLKEQLELQELNERAEQQNVPPDVLKRIDELEQKAARGDELEQQQQAQQINNLFWKAAESFVEGKDVSKEDLNKYMLENEIIVDVTKPDLAQKKFDMAYKAMQYDAMAKKLESAEKDGMKKLMHAKGSIPTIPGNAAQGQVVNGPPKTFPEARARAMQREF
ncbi:hypothetical protein NYE59_01670 [Paenibacillus sp. FSL L8-0323]|uniref:hypothetical protein n=1 Tax=Paenibacillus sp. FSL L8-0323 TaxID=2975330 RepID=UPI0030FC1929